MNQDSLILFSRLLLLAEAVAAIAGFITWYKWKSSYLKWFPFYLAIITMLEICNRALEYSGKWDASIIISEIEVLLEITFINWYFYNTLNRKNKSIVWLGIFSFSVSLILEKTFIGISGYYFQSLSYTVGNLFILVYLILFFNELVKGENILIFKRLTTFWIATGMLLFYLGSFPFYGLYNELAKSLDLFVGVAFVATFLNYCMYLFFTIGFIWGKAE